MLVLSRRPNETILIGDNIRFTVLSVHGNQVRIGFDVPDDVKIVREELLIGRPVLHEPKPEPAPEKVARTSIYPPPKKGLLSLRRRRSSANDLPDRE